MSNAVSVDVQERFRDLCCQVQSACAVYVMLDASTPGIAEIWQSYLEGERITCATVFAFRIAEVSEALGVPLFKPGCVVPGSTHLPLLALSRQAEHEYYWLVEDDALLTGDWGEMLGSLESEKSDLLCSHLAGFFDIPNWPFWPTLQPPCGAFERTDPLSAVRKAFFPVYRISAPGLETVLTYQRAGWRGHFEILLPTVLVHAGLLVRDFNSVSSSKLYTAGTIIAGEGSGPLSSLRYRPAIGQEELDATRANLIFHPVKLTAPARTTPAAAGKKPLAAALIGPRRALAAARMHVARSELGGAVFLALGMFAHVLGWRNRAVSYLSIAVNRKIGCPLATSMLWKSLERMWRTAR